MYTVFALDCNNEQLGDALFVGPEHLAEAIDTLITVWEAEQVENDHSDNAVVGVHCAVHQDSVRDGRGYKPLVWVPGEPVNDQKLL